MAKRKTRRTADDYGYFPPSRPIRVEGGIQSRSQRGGFAATWWAKRWLAVLESYGIGGRLQRGRSYARSGQVLKVDVQSGRVSARVQGSRPTPYRVDIQISTLPDAEWERVLDTISQQAIFAAQLLDGEMPQDIEAAFTQAGLSLFPAQMRDILTECSCPDYSNPCKHIAAVYYLLGEQFDRDPFLIFTLRGRTREQIIEALRRRRAATPGVRTEDATTFDSAPPAPSLIEQIADFWGSETFAWMPPSLTAPDGDGAVLRRLGTPPGDLKRPLEVLYSAITQHVHTRIMDRDNGESDPSP